jgi:hypothetical protein
VEQTINAFGITLNVQLIHALPIQHLSHAMLSQDVFGINIATQIHASCSRLMLQLAMVRKIAFLMPIQNALLTDAKLHHSTKNHVLLISTARGRLLPQKLRLQNVKPTNVSHYHQTHNARLTKNVNGILTIQSAKLNIANFLVPLIHAKLTQLVHGMDIIADLITLSNAIEEDFLRRLPLLQPLKNQKFLTSR